MCWPKKHTVLLRSVEEVRHVLPRPPGREDDKVGLLEVLVVDDSRSVHLSHILAKMVPDDLLENVRRTVFACGARH